MNNEIPFNTVKFLPLAEATLNRYLNFGNPNQTKHYNKRATEQQEKLYGER
jgi:hypothetical protein